VKTKLGEPWVPADRIEALVQLEPALVIAGLVLGAWLSYKLLLRQVSEERHRNLRGQFRGILSHLALATALFLSYYGLGSLGDAVPAAPRIATYVGLVTLLSGATVFVKTSRILLFEYLFLSHMRAGVPLLLVNIFSLVLSVLLGAWFATEVFGLRLAPLLATSAIFSLILGLALQDTLGNLFAGVALQFDKPYEIGDWIEVQVDGHTWVGQVQEISWRATVLIAFTDEAITVPNRVMGQSRISNFSVKTRPVIRSQLFRLPHGTSLERAREILVGAALQVPDIRKDPAPLVLVGEAAESWIAVKLVYFIDQFGLQYLIADQVFSRAISGLEKAGIALANPKVTVLRGPDAA
jgi:small-conductance mechanosensitive channel